MVVKELFKVKVKCLTWVCTIYYTYGKNATNTIEHADFFVQVFELFSLKSFDVCCNVRKCVFIYPFIYSSVKTGSVSPT